MGLLRRLYDPFIRWTMPTQTYRRVALAAADIGSGQRVLDLGCGTGSHAALIQGDHPDAMVVGIDVDLHVLHLARAHSAKRGATVRLLCATAAALPLATNTFDHVFCSLLLHDLSHVNKKRALSEATRVLRPGGVLHLIDFVAPEGWRMHAAFLLIRATHRETWLEANIEGALPELIVDAGLLDPVEVATMSTICGTVAVLRGRKPA
jgi:ubiquinone/menaquinone biosynthesis C-methylase UbiE